MKISRFILLVQWLVICLILLSCSGDKGKDFLSVEKYARITLVGNNLCSRMMNYGLFETELQLMFPDSNLVIRNMCDGGNTPGFRPHSGRNDPWAFEGAEIYQDQLARKTGSIGHLEYPDEWLSRLESDIIFAFFGFNESYAGDKGLALYKKELSAFVDHTKSQKYNGITPPQLVLFSPTAIEDLSDHMDVPDGKNRNIYLRKYANAMSEVAQAKEVRFVNLFHPSQKWFTDHDEPLTIDGLQFTEKGYQIMVDYMLGQLFGTGTHKRSYRELVHEAVMEKNWFWHNDFKIPNGVHVFGRRYDPFGPDNYPYELKKIRGDDRNQGSGHMGSS